MKSSVLIWLLLIVTLLHTEQSPSSSFSLASSLRSRTKGNGGNDIFRIGEICLYSSPAGLGIMGLNRECIHLSVCCDQLTVINDNRAAENVYQRSSALSLTGKNYTGIFGVYKLHLGYYVAMIVGSSKDVFPSISALHGVRSADRLEFIRIPSVPVGQDNMNKITLALIQKQRDVEALLQSTFNANSFYYSAGSYDITRTFQDNYIRCRNKSSELVGAVAMSPWRGCDERYFWNLNALAPLLAAGCGETAPSLIVPVTNAWLGATEIQHEGRRYWFTLLARRSRLRQGPRFIKRGGDSLGNVANFVESEQILERADGQGTSSFVQARGSVPLLWRQIVNGWRVQPTIAMVSDRMRTQRAVLSSHLNALYCRYCTTGRNVSRSVLYPSVYLVNLIDKKGTQGRLGAWLQAAFNFQSTRLPRLDEALGEVSAPDSRETVTVSDRLFREISRGALGGIVKADFAARLIWFDYHHKCCDRISPATTKRAQKMDSTNAAPRSVERGLSQLRELHRPLSSAMDSTGGGMFAVLGSVGDDNEAVRWQDKLIRTNCIDCLDRTNVAQTTISRWMLRRQLALLSGAIDSVARVRKADADDSLVLNDMQTETVLRHLWVDCGDYLSMLYAGSRAMKRDVTRSGQRTHKGAMDDAIASVQRHFINNWFDRDRQRGVDILLGKIDASGNKLNCAVDVCHQHCYVVMTTVIWSQLSELFEDVLLNIDGVDRKKVNKKNRSKHRKATKKQKQHIRKVRIVGC